MRLDPLEPRRLFAVTFSSSTTDAGPAPFRLTTGDFNADGNADVVVVNTGSRANFGVSFGISILQGSGDGTLAAPRFIYETDDQIATSIQAIDLDADGDLDLVAANVVLLNTGATGNAAFTATVLPGTPNRRTFAVGELSGDGVPDIVFEDNDSEQPMLRVGRGNGSFSDAIPLPLVGDFPAGAGAVTLGSKYLPAATNSTAQGRPNSYVMGDVNRDGIPDVIVFTPFSNRVKLYIGTDEGDSGTILYRLKSDVATFDQLPMDAKLYVVGTYASLLELPSPNDDLSTNGSRVLPTGASASPPLPRGFFLFVDSSDGSFNVSRFDDTGSLIDATRYSLGSFPKSMALDDINNDGALDVLIADNFGDNLSLLLGNGDGTVQARQVIVVGNGPNDAIFVDLNNDGRPDIVSTNTTDDTLSIQLTQATPDVKPAPVVTLSSSNVKAKPTDAVTLTARITGASAIGATVRFFDRDQLIGTAVVDGNGLATLTTTFTLGTHLLRAGIAATDTLGQAVSPALDQYAVDAITPPVNPKLTIAGVPTTGITAGTKLPSLTITPGTNVTIPKGAKLTPTIASGPSGATFTGPKSVAFKKGAAVVKSLSFRTAGTYTLTFTSSAVDLGAVTTSAFTIIPAAAKRVVFSNVPATLAASAPFTATASLADKFGNVVTTDNTTAVTVSLAGKASSLLTGTLTRTATAGVLTFDNLAITTAGRYTLFAKSAKGIAPAKTTLSVTGIAPSATAFPPPRL